MSLIREKILNLLKQCEEKDKFKELMSAYDDVWFVSKSSSPTKHDRQNFDSYVRRLQSAMLSFKWIVQWPNQFIRMTHHNGYFLNDLEGTGSIGPHSTEPLEAANKWVKNFDYHHTFKGNRKQAIKGIFKLRRLKSSYLLRKHVPISEASDRKCSVCHCKGYYKNNPICPGRIYDDHRDVFFISSVEPDSDNSWDNCCRDDRIDLNKLLQL